MNDNSKTAANEKGVAECPAFIPTRDELLELVRYWARRALDSETFCFFTGYGDSGNIPYANWRLDLVAGMVGIEDAKKVFAEVEDEFRKAWGDPAWGLFKNYDHEGLAWLYWEGDGDLYNYQPFSAYMRPMEERAEELISRKSASSSGDDPVGDTAESEEAVRTGGQHGEPE